MRYHRGDMRFLIIFCLILAAVLTGCQPVSDVIVTVPGHPEYLSPPPQRHYLAGVSIENRAIECQVFGEGRDVIFILAAIHGNEQAGISLCRRMVDYLQQNPNILKGRKIVLMPIANPDGVAHNQRHNVRGIDLNRNFEAANRQNNAQFGFTAFSEPESRVIKNVIQEHAPDRIVTLHEPLNCIDWDGPGRQLAERMGEYCDLPVRKLGANPGSLGAYAGETLGIPIITVEFPRDSGKLDSEFLWVQYGKMLLAAVVYPDHLFEETDQL